MISMSGKNFKQYEMDNERRDMYYIWGTFDVLHVVIYGFISVIAGRIPYVSDYSSIVDNLASYGDLSMVWLFSTSWLLEFSLLLSIFMFFSRNKKVLFLCYVQTPLRLISSTPSISLVYPVLSFMGFGNIWMAAVILIVSEVIKIHTVRKYR